MASWILILQFGLTTTTSGVLDLASQTNNTSYTIPVTMSSTTRSHKQEVLGDARSDVPWASWLVPLKATEWVTTTFVWPMESGFPIAPGETYHRIYKTTKKRGGQEWEYVPAMEAYSRSTDWTTVSLNEECAAVDDCRSNF